MAKKSVRNNDIRLTFDIPMDTIVEELSKLNQCPMFELIKALDLNQQDYEFTEKLTKYFINELRKECDSFDINELYEEVKKEYLLQ